jgi:hypothetical protein
MQHLVWFLDLKWAKDAEIMCEVTLLSADYGLNGKRTPEGKIYQQG